MAKIKEIKIHEKMYQVDISILIGGTVKDLISLIKRRHKTSPMYSWDQKFEWEPDADTTDGYQFHIPAPLGEGEKFYIWVSSPTPYLVSHETYHLVSDILFTRGVEYSYESEESYAYLYGYIFQQILNKLKLEQ